MKRFIIILCTLLGLIVSGLCQDPKPLIPKRFSENFVFTIADDHQKYIQMGKLWFNSPLKLGRIDMQNDVLMCPQYFLVQNVKCQLLTTVYKWYYIVPSKSLCCIELANVNYIQRKLFGDYLQYKGDKILDNITYNWWHQKKILFDKMDYLTDKSQILIPRQLRIGNMTQYQMVDFWTNTFSTEYNTTAVFQIPSYCQRYCQPVIPSSQHIKNKKHIQFPKLIKNLISSI